MNVDVQRWHLDVCQCGHSEWSHNYVVTTAWTYGATTTQNNCSEFRPTATPASRQPGE